MWTGKNQGGSCRFLCHPNNMLRKPEISSEKRDWSKFIPIARTSVADWKRNLSWQLNPTAGEWNMSSGWNVDTLPFPALRLCYFQVISCADDKNMTLQKISLPPSHWLFGRRRMEHSSRKIVTLLQELDNGLTEANSGRYSYWNWTKFMLLNM
jgi:hypothetical protein